MEMRKMNLGHTFRNDVQKGGRRVLHVYLTDTGTQSTLKKIISTLINAGLSVSEVLVCGFYAILRGFRSLWDF